MICSSGDTVDADRTARSVRCAVPQLQSSAESGRLIPVAVEAICRFIKEPRASTVLDEPRATADLSMCAHGSEKLVKNSER
jgi:hypothetical protein